MVKQATDPQLFSSFEQTRNKVPGWARRVIPAPLRRFGASLYWVRYEFGDFLAEVVGCLPWHTVRLFLLRTFLGIKIGRGSSIHRGCRLYYARGVSIGEHTIINRDVLLDGRMGLTIGSNVSISEGVAIFSLEHDPDSPTFGERGSRVFIADRVFIGARAMLLPGVSVSEGAVVAAGAVVTRDVESFTIVAGVPARFVKNRTRDLSYTLDYRKFLG